jgi:1-acyl-sn-glycerol-3-phosphate acyltransferase
VGFLRAALHQLIFLSGSIPIVFAAVIGSWFSQKATIRWSRRWGKWHIWCARRILGITVRVEGELPQYSCLVVMKHQSAFEASATLAWFDRPIVVMKQELFDIPVWGRASRAHGSIPVNREAGSAALRAMIAAAKVARESGRPVILFPEGTRVGVGEAPPLKAGFAGLYKVLGLPVVPIALDSGRLWGAGFVKSPGIVTLKVGDAIPPGLPRDEAEALVHGAINSLDGAG